MIINIWAKLDLIQEKLEELTSLNVFAGKPIQEPTWMYVYFELQTNSAKIRDDSTWVLYKEALFDFYIISNNVSTPDVELYEKLDQISNSITWFRIDLNWFEILDIQEWNQSWVLRNDKNNPLVIAQYSIIYKYLY